MVINNNLIEINDYYARYGIMSKLPSSLPSDTIQIFLYKYYTMPSISCYLLQYYIIFYYTIYEKILIFISKYFLIISVIKLLLNIIIMFNLTNLLKKNYFINELKTIFSIFEELNRYYVKIINTKWFWHKNYSYIIV